MVSASSIKSLQDIMRKDVGVDGDAQRLGQLVWMIFLKVFDDREYEWEALDPTYRSPIRHGLRWRDWAADSEGITGDRLLGFINDSLFPAMKSLAQNPADDRAAVVGSVFEDAYNYMKSGTLLRQVLNKIQSDLDFNKSEDRHTFGDLYERLLRDLQSAGNAGEYYTPRPVTQFMVEMVDPKPDETILDPACGTGGFLTCALEHMRASYVHTAEDELEAQSSLNGVEKKQLPHLLCVTNMILHGIDVPTRVRHDNTLRRPLRDYGPADRVDVVLTNPPFGGVEEDGIEGGFPSAFRTKETADLFLVLIMHLLNANGRAAVVLPDGSLYGDGVKARIRQRLLQEFNLHTIVRLPSGVFAPYTGIRTNLLFFERGGPTKAIWFYEHRIPSGRASYSKTRPLKYEHLDPIREWWSHRVENDCAWRVEVDELDDSSFNLDLSHPSHRDQQRPTASAAESRLERAEREVAASESALTSTLNRIMPASSEIDTVGRVVSNKASFRADIDSQVERIRRALVSYLVKVGISEPHDLVEGATESGRAPVTWGRKTLRELGSVHGGMTPPKSTPRFWEGDVAWTSSKDMKPRLLLDTELHISTEAVAQTSLQWVPANSVLMVVRSGILRRTFPVVINSIPVTINQDLKALVLADATDAPYVQLMLEGFESLILSQMVKRGTTVQSILVDQLFDYSFPWPEKQEREAIVQCCSDIQAALSHLCEASEERAAAYSSYSDALLGPVVEI